MPKRISLALMPWTLLVAAGGNVAVGAVAAMAADGAITPARLVAVWLGAQPVDPELKTALLRGPRAPPKSEADGPF